MKELIINEIFFALVEGLFIFLIFSTVIINERKSYIIKHKYRVLLFIILYTVSSFWITLSFPYGFHTLILTLFIGMLLSVITKNSIIMSFVSVIIAAIIVLVTELLIIVLFNMSIEKNINDIISNPVLKMKFSIIAKIIQMIVAILIYRSNLKPIVKASTNKESTNLLNYSVLGIFMMCFFFLSLNYIIYNPKELIKYEVLLFLIFLFYILFGIFDFRDRTKLLSIQQKYTLQVEYINNLESIINVIRREKHDFSNHLNAIHAICLMNKPDAIEKIKSYVGKLAYNLKEAYKSFETGNVYIDGLLVVKSNYAFENDINLDVEIEAPLSYLDVKDNDVISAVSNVLDNAFDAIISVQKHDGRAVSLCTYIEDNEYCISIANTGNKIPQDIISKIFENGFSTKKDASEHGLGLYIVNSIVKKHNGHIEVYSSDIETQFIMKFKLEDRCYGQDCRILDNEY